MPGLDGVRAVAVLATLLFHTAVLPGGFIGVDIFMVLSGYLITRLLLEEHRSNHRIDLRGFWRRRLRRLVPALTLMLVGYLVLTLGLALAGAPIQWGLEAKTLLAGQTYIVNWLLAYRVEVAPTLHHLWSLSVEEQFYLAWPPLLALLLRCRSQRLAIVATGAIIVASIGSALIDDGHSRLYYGSDFRAHQLLAGCLLAQLQVLGATRVIECGSRLWRWVGAGASVMLVWWATTERWVDTDLVWTGVPVTVAATVFVAITALDNAAPMTRLLCWEPLRWLGARSYEIYLAHYPLTRWAELYDIRGPIAVVGICALSLALGDLLHRGHRGALAAYDQRRGRGPGAATQRVDLPAGAVTA
jgi:peptidoglycan/LPS O-acetylase OafA/YrhL